MILQKGKTILGIDKKIIDKDNIILNNYRYPQNEVIPPVPVPVDSYDLISKTFLTGVTINNDMVLPNRVVSASMFSTSGGFTLTLSADLQDTDIVICNMQSVYSNANYTLNPLVITKWDVPATVSNYNQIRIEVRTISNSGTIQQSLTNSSVKYCVLVYRKKTEVI